MVGRFLLTLLALLTGFAVQGAPAEARVLCRAEVGTVASGAAVRKAVVPVAIRGATVQRVEKTQVLTDCAPAPTSSWRAPSILTGIDQSLE